MTNRLMGVDFVPAFRVGESAPAIDVDAEPTEVGAPESGSVRAEPVRPAVAAAESPSSDIEAKPLVTARPVAVARGTTRSADSSAAALEELKAKYIKAAPHAPFIKAFTNIVFGEGDPCARLMFVGEAPGEEEDRTGRPFVGRAGQLLEKMIVAMGLSRESVYICNVLKVRPPNNATPTLEEAAASEPYLLEQIDIVAPEAIVTLGKSATACVLKLDLAMGAMRGRWHDLKLPTGRAVPVMPTFHPAYLLRSYTEENRKKVWSDLQLVMQRLGAIVAG